MDEFDFQPQGPARRSRRGGRGIIALLRLLLIVGTAILAGYLVWLGSWYGLIAWALTIIVLIDTAVNVLFGLFDEPGSRRLGFMFWVSSLFMGTLSVQMVTKEVKVRPIRPPGPLAALFARLGAPAVVVIENGVAAIFERSGRYTRVKGPGVVLTRRFERVAQVVDLRPQVRSRVVEKVLTKDGLAFDVKPLTVLFQLAAPFDPNRGEYAFSEEAMLDLVYRGGLLYDKGQEVEWGDRVVAAVEYDLRNVAAVHNITELVRGDTESARKRLMDDLDERARPALEQIGVRLIGIDIGRIVVPSEVEDLLTMPLKQTVDIGWAHTQRDTIIGIAEGLKQAIAKIQAAMADESREMRSQLLLHLTTSLGQMLEDSQRLAAPYREEGETRRLLRGGEGKIIISGFGHDVDTSGEA